MGHTVHAGVLVGHHVVYTHKLDGHDQFVMRSRVGAAAPLHCTGMGKALLAHLPEDHLAAVLAAADRGLGMTSACPARSGRAGNRS